jgi:hypothetical protein
MHVYPSTENDTSEPSHDNVVQGGHVNLACFLKSRNEYILFLSI